MMMNRQAAFVGNGKLLKGALHCHTTRSDGRGAPAEVIALHKLRGYDFMALTDHRIYNYANYAQDVEMTIVPGMEMDRSMPDRGVHCFHAVSIGPAREDGNGFAQDQRFETGAVRDQFEFQKVLDMLHENGNMTIYCHPEWSNTPAREFEQLQGNFAMEIWNSGCAMEHDLDSNAAYWDELLMQGKRIFGVATDDGHAMEHHCNGWVRVNAQNDLPSILDALNRGAFYASCGPEIYDFRVEDGVAVLDCSPCRYAGFRFGHMPSRLTRARELPVTHATYAVPDYFTYLRGIVMDEQGRRAWTNPIFLDGRG